MFVTIDGDRRVALTDPADFRAFAIRAPVSMTRADVDAALRSADLGEIDGAHAWIRSGALAALLQAHGGSTAEGSGWSAMLDYARGHGWWRDADEALRGHVEWTDR